MSFSPMFGSMYLWRIRKLLSSDSRKQRCGCNLGYFKAGYQYATMLRLLAVCHGTVMRSVCILLINVQIIPRQLNVYTLDISGVGLTFQLKVAAMHCI